MSQNATDWERIPEFASRSLREDRKKQIMHALIELHKIGVFHGDARAENMLFDSMSHSVKMIDFARSYWHECGGLSGCDELTEIWRVLFQSKPMRPLRLRTQNAEDNVIGASKEEKARFRNQLGLCLLPFCGKEFVDTVII
ncbi:uncharacterized protein FOMMEDRAFT_163109 [Fomitiporia mediterranea MF3/22]|uniref:Non-specific serine/threonine protein kinase n=1 Tax=Fomitiporia mediterranea (strain MF3/22) TaxID=694068 RepID=R7SGC3_FOMME|nr:uncharacterized protein FOMMEDRAFT_163109 [Fomitiporia mediterranea MF3/22]EJC97490.1 hypothetical protein FOMMEDRAFT_163109 [Fomitiporia mediterranea MF3/22]